MAAGMLPIRYHHPASGLTATLLFTLLALSSWTIQSVAASGRVVAGAAVVPEVPVLLPPAVPSEEQTGRTPGADGQLLEFKLQHIFHHGTHKYPRLHRRLDVPADARLLVTSDEAMDPEPAPRLRARSQPTTIQRLADRSASHINDILEYGRMNGHPMPLPASAWTEDELSGPNATDKETVLSFARMASNAYILEPHTGEWQDVGGGFNYTEDFGWQADGLRGHIFADTKNQTVIIGLKGTSVAVFDGADTTTNDKVNDNLFFSCCCGQGGSFLWLQVCDCQTSTYTCNSTCLVQALKAKNHYYYAVQDLYHNVTAIYPDADIWVTGHSLGGSVVSLLGLTFGLPTVTFEAPGEALPAMRLGLPTPPGYRAGSHQQRANTGGYHFGHTADPIFMGTCSMCTLAGYAMQSVCHSGLTCEYDTVKDFGWRQGLGYHRIVNVIHNVIEKYDQPAKCEPYEDCVDCFNWKFYESNSSTTTSSSSSSSSTTRTRTATCKTPGWWGCLDETTTSGTTSTHSASTSTSTCKTPGWFGCKDPTTTTTTTSSSSQTAAPAPTITTTSSTPTASSPSTSCDDPGWFGCNDPTSTVKQTSHKHRYTASPTAECTSREWFVLICVDPSPVTSTNPRPTSSRTAPVRHRTKCAHRYWFGGCKDWEDRDEM